MAQAPIKDAWWSEEKENDYLRLKEDLKSTENTLERMLQAKKIKDSEISVLKVKNEQLQRDYEEMANRVDTITDEKESIHQQLNASLLELKLEKSLKDELQREKQRITEDYSGQQQRKDKEMQHKAVEIQSLKDQIQREKQLIIDHYSIQLNRKDEEIKNKAVEIQSLHGSLQQFQKEIDAYVKNKDSEVKSILSEIQQKDNTIKQLLRQREEERTAKEEERRQKDEALTRLIAVAGDRLRNNNPGITDLSDPNRSMKIAEKFTEMYDNDWTDAMESLEELKIEENQCMEVLLHFLTDAYEECKRIISDLDDHLVKAVTLTVFENGCKETDIDHKSKQCLPAELSKPILDLRKTFTSNSVRDLQKRLPEVLKAKRQLTDEHMKACETFVADCIKYAWMMQIQDPPVYIEWEFPKGSKIDTNILRFFINAGDCVDFVVWPVLYLHKGGPVLNKGVVQPLKNKE